MSTTRWDLVEDLDGLRRSMDRMFDELLLRQPRRRVSPVVSKEWEPIEILETGTEVIVRAELRNIDPKKVDITVVKAVYKNGVLEVKIPKLDDAKPIPVEVPTQA